mgnify:FL=1
MSSDPTTNITILQAEALNIGLDRDTVFFTIEPSVQEAIDNGSNVISVTVKGANEGMVWIHHTEVNMITDLRHQREHYDRFLKWAMRIWMQEVGE